MHNPVECIDTKHTWIPDTIASNRHLEEETESSETSRSDRVSAVMPELKVIDYERHAIMGHLEEQSHS